MKVSEFASLMVRLELTGILGRIKSNFAISRLSDKDFQAINDLAIPHDGGRTISFTKEWGAQLYQN